MYKNMLNPCTCILIVAAILTGSACFAVDIRDEIRDASKGFRTLSGEQAMVPFAGSDFWLADFGFEFLQWPQQRLLKIKNAMRKGRPCRVLESTNPQPTKDGYSRVVSWIDRETDGLILADAYGPDGKVLKHFSIGSITKVNDRWELKNMEIRNEKTDSRTRIEFDFRTKQAVPAK